MVDYIVVGGGPAGCVTAARLSEDPATQVVLFEQGPSDTNPYIHIPATYYKTCRGDLLTRYQLEPQKHQNGATPEMIQGRVLGGGSSVNAMVHIRGCPADYDGWAAAGCHGWSFDEVLPYFRRTEDNDTYAGHHHAQDGPLGVSNQRYTHYLTKAWVQACQEQGIPYNPDFNSGNQAGTGLYQVMIRDGRRSSAAVAYLKPARDRSNLQVRTGHKVTRVVIENGRAVGVEYVDNGRLTILRAEREVILSAGAIASPHLLLLSGIGPAEQLRQHGITVHQDLPGVGENLQDHMDVFLIYDLNGAHSYDKYKQLHWQARAGLQYALFRDGPAASNICEGGLFWYGDPNDPLPNLQYHFFPGAGVEEGTDSAPSGNGATLNICQTRPRSRGTIRLKSADPMQNPAVDPNYLADSYDRDVLVEGLRVGQEIFAQPSLAKYVNAMCRPAKPMQTRAEFEDFVTRTAQGAIHPCGACKMGTDDMAVVDPQLRVHGIEGLRVADTSIMPLLVSGNTTAPSLMVGERLADFVLGKAPLPPLQNLTAGLLTQREGIPVR